MKDYTLLTTKDGVVSYKLYKLGVYLLHLESIEACEAAAIVVTREDLENLKESLTKLLEKP